MNRSIPNLCAQPIEVHGFGSRGARTCTLSKSREFFQGDSIDVSRIKAPIQSVLGLGHGDHIIPRYAAIFFSVSVFPAWVAMTCETLDYGGLC